MVDVRTLLLLVAPADVAVAVVLAVGAGRRLRFGIAPWIGSLFMRCLAISVLVARLEPQAAVLVVSAALLSLSISLQAGALAAYDGRDDPGWEHSAPVAGVPVPVDRVWNQHGSSVMFPGPRVCNPLLPLR